MLLQDTWHSTGTNLTLDSLRQDNINSARPGEGTSAILYASRDSYLHSDLILCLLQDSWRSAYSHSSLRSDSQQKAQTSSPEIQALRLKA